MVPRRRVIRVYRGDATPLRFFVTAPDDAGVQQPVSLLGATVTFTAKVREEDTSALFSVAATVIGPPANGEAEVQLTPGNTSGLAVPTTLYWDLELIDATTAPHTVDAGYLLVMRDIKV